MFRYGFTLVNREGTTPTHSELSAMFDALQTVTGAELHGNEGFYNKDGKLFYGDNIDQPVTLINYVKASVLCGFTKDYIEEWCLEYCEEGRSWNELPD